MTIKNNLLEKLLKNMPRNSATREHDGHEIVNSIYLN